MNAASVQLFGAALDASDLARATGNTEVIPGQKSHYGKFGFAIHSVVGVGLVLRQCGFFVCSVCTNQHMVPQPDTTHDNSYFEQKKRDAG